MFCPKCGKDTKVISSTNGTFRERTRKCDCGYVFLTIELVKTDPYLMQYISEIAWEIRKKQ